MRAGEAGAKRIRVGIIGASPDRGWAADAHIPALKSLSDDFEITALSTSRRESADAAGKLFGVPAVFHNHQELVNRARRPCPDARDDRTRRHGRAVRARGPARARAVSLVAPQGPGLSANVAQAYVRFASDYREGTHFCSTFDDAVTRHRMLDAIETAAATGVRQALG